MHRCAVVHAALLAALSTSMTLACVSPTVPEPVVFNPGNGTPPDQAGATPLTGPVVVAAGDIAGPWAADEATAKLIDDIDPAHVLTLGDNAYDTGTASQFDAHYEPTWGRHKAKTRPSPGNHDHGSGLGGYCSYFGSAAGCQGGVGYHSFNVGSWHVVSLDSGCSSPSSCDNPMANGTAMREWLSKDLAANTARCTLVYWHHPRFSSGQHGSDPRSSAVWNVLYEHNVDVVLNGHEHNYERFAPQAPSGAEDAARGIVQFVVGTGGVGLRGMGTVKASSAVRNNTTHGVLKLTLGDGAADFAFVPVAGSTFTDRGTIPCH